VRGTGKVLVKRLHVLVHEGVVVQQDRKPGELLLGRQFAIDEQVGGLLESGPLGQLLHGDTPVAQDAFLPVHEGDGALATAGVGIARVEGDQTGVPAQQGDVDRLLPCRSRDEGQPELLARIDKSDVFGHGRLVSEESGGR
jgi:hypothetical protein